MCMQTPTWSCPARSANRAWAACGAHSLAVGRACCRRQTTNTTCGLVSCRLCRALPAASPPGRSHGHQAGARHKRAVQPLRAAPQLLLLGVLGVGDIDQLVPSVQRRLEAALADGTAFDSVDAALHALRMAAFAAEAMQHVGLAAGVEPDPLPQPPAARALLDQARLPALQQLSSAARAQVQAQLLLTAMQLVPAVVGAADALLQHGMLQAGPQCSSLHSRKVLLLGSFLMWLGRWAAATTHAFSPQAPIGDAIASIARTWLLVQTRLLQLHAAYPSATGSSGSSSSHLAGLQSLLSGLSQCIRGLTELNGQLQLAARAAVLAESSTAAGSGAAGQHPLLPTMWQLVTTASITAHLAAGLPQLATDAAAQQAKWHLLACSPGEPPVVRGADLIGSAMTGLRTCLKGPWNLPEDADGRPAAAALEVGW